MTSFTAPTKPGLYWVNCSVKRTGDNRKEVLASRRLRVITEAKSSLKQRFTSNVFIDFDVIEYPDSPAYYDFEYASLDAANPIVSAAVNVETPVLQSLTPTQTRLFKPADKQPITLYFDFTFQDGTTERRTVIWKPAPHYPPAVYANVTDGQIIEGDDDALIEWRVGTEGKTGDVSVSITHVTGSGTGGVTGFTSETTPASSVQTRNYLSSIWGYGEWVVTVTYADGEVHRTRLSRPQPTSAALSPSLFLSPAEVFSDEKIAALMWSDHTKTHTRKQLIITGTSQSTIDLPLRGSSSQLSIGPFPAGNYEAQLICEYSDADPNAIATDKVPFTVKVIPLTTLTTEAWADHNDVAKWQTIIDDARSTNRQKAVASYVADLVDAISGVKPIPGLSPAEGQIILDQYVLEQATQTNPLTLAEWHRQQRDWASPAEQAEGRELMVNAPTNSVPGLLAYFSATKHPIWTIQRALIGGKHGYSEGDYDYIARNAATNGGPVPDATLLADFRLYQQWLLSSTWVEPFEIWNEEIRHA